MIKVAYHVNG